MATKNTKRHDKKTEEALPGVSCQLPVVVLLRVFCGHSLLLLSAFSVLVLPAMALAHPVPRDNHDRTLVVYLTPAAVLVDYRLEVYELRALRDLDEAEVSLTGVRSRQDVHAAYLRHLSPVLLG